MKCRAGWFVSGAALVEPRAYLGEATPRAIRNAGTVTLARDLKESRQMRCQRTGVAP